MLRFLSAPKSTEKLLHKQPMMNWEWVQYGFDVNSLYLLANEITLIYPSHY